MLCWQEGVDLAQVAKQTHAWPIWGKCTGGHVILNPAQVSHIFKGAGGLDWTTSPQRKINHHNKKTYPNALKHIKVVMGPTDLGFTVYDRGISQEDYTVVYDIG